MKRRQIFEALRDSSRPLTIEKLSEKTDIPIPSLRIDLFRLQEENEIESIEEGEKLKWKIKVSNPVEEKYEKMTRKNTS